MTDHSVEFTVTVGTAWTYIGKGESLRLKSIDHAAGVAVIEVATAARAFPADEQPAATREEHP